MWLVLILLLPLCLGDKVDPGCESWTFVSMSSNEVCCERCKPGNRLVKKCDLDVEVLCTPCENGSYTDSNTAKFCKTCTECISPLRVKKLCTSSSDAVCECVNGFQCGDRACSFCIRQCGKGEEPTEDRDCRPCPAGTFNSKIHQQCVKWSSSCPSPDQQIVAEGTAVSDIVCTNLKPSTPTDTPLKTDGKDPGTTLVIAIICACLIISAAMPLCVTMHFKKERAAKMPLRTVEDPAGRGPAPEPEQCSFCFPQEEHGSHSSLLSDDKPFELVV